MWIFGAPARDIAIMYLGGAFAFAFVWLAPIPSAISNVMALLTLAVVDTGHMYTTVWRTVFRKKELESSARYWVTPLVVFGVILIWALLRVPFLFNVLVYATIYHHMRQYYGVVRWYEKLNRRTDRPSHYFIHLLFILPLLLAHFRTDGIDHIFYRGDVFIYPSAALFRFFFTAYVITLVAWVGHEAALWTRGVREPNRLMAIAVPMLFTGVGCLFGKNGLQVLMPLIWTHGIAYFGLMSLSMNRLEPKRWRGLLRPAAVIVFTAAVAGGLAFYLDEAFLETAYEAGLPLGHLIFIAALQTPSVCHYIFDMWIWTGRHREAKTVYALPAAALKK